MDLSPYLETNRRRWDELVAVHERSAFYDVDGFRAGKSSLRPLERQELGDVAGKTLLHLQCHFGLDTLSWARLGARVTGVDFSGRAVERARALARDVGLEAEFLCSDVYDLPRVLARRFDVVFTSYGVLPHLPDLPRWARVAAHFLEPGGTFYLAEIHPVAVALDDREGGTGPKLAYNYFHSPEPIRGDGPGSYADRGATFENTVCYEWAHSLADVVNAVLDAGLRLEFLHEFPYCVCALTPYLELGPDGWWRLPGGAETVPLLFSLRATK